MRLTADVPRAAAAGRGEVTYEVRSGSVTAAGALTWAPKAVGHSLANFARLRSSLAERYPSVGVLPLPDAPSLFFGNSEAALAARRQELTSFLQAVLREPGVVRVTGRIMY